MEESIALADQAAVGTSIDEKQRRRQALRYANLFWLFLAGNVLGVLLEGRRERLWAVFTLCGVATAYFDFLTYPLAALGVLGAFVGMLTDSRSFISYPRHEYFRRILCNLIGQWVENGEYPNDIEFLKGMVRDISYNNAKEYFGI